MNLLDLKNPQAEVEKITWFISRTFQKTNIQNAIVAVSGGIDSALSLALTVGALGKDRVIPLLLPYGDQDMSDAQLVTDELGLDENQVRVVNILPFVNDFCDILPISEQERVRKGNVMARVRMTVIYDYAKQHRALVVGTENKSESYLGYFTRFGDEASDLEPLIHLYKTQVRQLAKHLNLPQNIQTKLPSADLWPNQTDEDELGFSYELADQVLFAWKELEKNPDEIMIDGLTNELKNKIIERVKLNQYKHQVPYKL